MRSEHTDTYKILHYNYSHPSLSLITPTLEVIYFSREIHKCIQIMHDVLGKNKDGIALASNQLGFNYSIFVYVDPILSVLRTVLNPEIVYCENLQNKREGCLSFPNLFLNIPRYEKITVKYTDFPSMEEYRQDFVDLTAQIFQHEIEHLSGKVFIDNIITK